MNNKDYYYRNREEILLQKKKYHQEHLEERKAYARKWREKNKEQRIKEKKLYYQLNRERLIDKQKKIDKEYYQKNKEQISLRHQKYTSNNRKKINERTRLKKQENINFKLACGLRDRVCKAIKGNYKSGSAVQDLGCSIPELKLYLESKFQEGMFWGNWSKTGWHIDHIIPLASFDLTNRKDFLRACHYTNLQPLWAEENIKKSNKTIQLGGQYEFSRQA